MDLLTRIDPTVPSLSRKRLFCNRAAQRTSAFLNQLAQLISFGLWRCYGCFQKDLS
jgi:hypothetical protein